MKERKERAFPCSEHFPPNKENISCCNETFSSYEREHYCLAMLSLSFSQRTCYKNRSMILNPSRLYPVIIEDRNRTPGYLESRTFEDVWLSLYGCWSHPPRDGAGQMINIPGVGLFDTLFDKLVFCPCSRQ